MKGPCSTPIHDYVKFMKPSATCQACYSEQQMPKDIIITCDICRSSIHQMHYGSQLLNPPQIWRCQRCRYFLENGTDKLIKCEFCPNIRGIMKQFTFKQQKMWVHPECATWGYPLIYYSATVREELKHDKIKNQSTLFWTEDYDENKYPCQVCKQTSGFRLKCRYYSCKKSYHVTCARPLGVVRDLQTFRIENTNSYFPVYCRDHIQLKIADYKARANNLKENSNSEKSHHFFKLSVLLQGQLNFLKQAVKKCQAEEEMLQRFIMQASKTESNKEYQIFNNSKSYHSEDSGSSFLHLLEQNIIDSELHIQIKAFTEVREKNSVKNQPRKRGSLIDQQPLKDQAQKDDNNKSPVSVDQKKQPKKKRGPPKKLEKNHQKKPAKVSHKKKTSVSKEPEKYKIDQEDLAPLEDLLPLKQDERDIERIIQGSSEDDLVGKPDHILPLHQQHSNDLQKSRYGHHKDRKRNFLSDQEQEDQQDAQKEEDDEQYQPEQDERESEEEYSEHKIFGKSKRFREFQKYEDIIHEPIYKPEQLVQQQYRLKDENSNRDEEQIFQEDMSDEDNNVNRQLLKKEENIEKNETKKMSKKKEEIDEKSQLKQSEKIELNEGDSQNKQREIEVGNSQLENKNVNQNLQQEKEPEEIIEVIQKIEVLSENKQKKEMGQKDEREENVQEKNEKQNEAQKIKKEGQIQAQMKGQKRENEEERWYQKFFEDFF